MPPKDSSLSQNFLNEKEKAGSIYEKIYRNNINEPDSFKDDDVGLEYIFNKVKSALLNYNHDVLSNKNYHCKVFIYIK